MKKINNQEELSKTNEFTERLKIMSGAYNVKALHIWFVENKEKKYNEIFYLMNLKNLSQKEKTW